MSALQKVSKVVARTGAALLCVLTVAGCGSSRHSHVMDEGETTPPLAREQPAPAVKAKPSRPAVEPRTYGARYSVPGQCEAAARRLLAVSRDDAWTALKSCVDGTHFTLLGAVLGDDWAEELRVRPDAAKLIAQVVAKRGGSVDGELPLLHARKVPIFGLTAAVSQPEVYKGRYVLLRAQVADVRSDGDKPTVWLVEQKLGSVETEYPVGHGTRKDSVTVYSGAVGGDVGILGRSNLGGQVSSSQREDSSSTMRRYDNISE
ncbi:MAG TPA: hypothetical protein VF794_05800, partial [Archangium sp.]|uniref:hypothetical protein n=1 Tax=Archangium sp. TaxID=1872627 RepID=UPI002EDB6D15